MLYYYYQVLKKSWIFMLRFEWEPSFSVFCTTSLLNWYVDQSSCYSESCTDLQKFRWDYLLGCFFSVCFVRTCFNLCNNRCDMDGLCICELCIYRNSHELTLWMSYICQIRNVSIPKECGSNVVIFVHERHLFYSSSWYCINCMATICVECGTVYMHVYVADIKIRWSIVVTTCTPCYDSTIWYCEGTDCFTYLLSPCGDPSFF